MAEAKSEDHPVSCRHRMCDEEDELELFSVELMLNLMKYFSNANIVVMPELPKPSKYYSITILKSVILAWRITRSIFAQRFRTAFRFMLRGRHEIFSYSTYQADELFDRMEPYAQLIYLAAYCYELSNFLSRNGQEQYIYVSYTLFTTIWSHLYQERFDRAGGWLYAERELIPYESVFGPLESIFFPGYQYNFNDLVTVQTEFQIVKERKRYPDSKPLKLEIQSSFGNDGGRMRQRMVTSEDRELAFLDLILDFNNLKFLMKMPVFPPEKLIGYLEKRAKREGKYKGYADLLKFYDLEESETLLQPPSVSGSDVLTLDSSSVSGSKILTQSTPPVSGSDVWTPRTPPLPVAEGLTPRTPPLPVAEGLTPRTPPLSGAEGFTPSTPPLPGNEGFTPRTPPLSGAEGFTQSTPPVSCSACLIPSTPPVSGSEVSTPSASPGSGSEVSTPSTPSVSCSKRLTQSTSPISGSEGLIQSSPPVSGSETLSDQSTLRYVISYRSIVRFFSFLLYDVPELIAIEDDANNQSVEVDNETKKKQVASASGAKPKQKKSGAKGGKTSQSESPTNCETKTKTNAKVKLDDQLSKKKQFETSKSPNSKSAAAQPKPISGQAPNCGKKPKTNTKLKSNDQPAKKNQFDTSKSPNAKDAPDELSSKSARVQPESSKDPAANCGAKPKTKPTPDNQSAKKKQSDTSQSPNLKSAGVEPESPRGQATCGTKPKMNKGLKLDDQTAKKKQFETSKSPNAKSSKSAKGGKKS